MTLEREAQHTPVPWFINGPGHLQAATPIIGNRSNGEPIPGNPAIIAKILSENPMDEAFILRACNSHDALLAALRSIENTAMRAGGHGVICQAVLTEARQAIAKAEKEA